jgi:hypothetical protein
MAECQPSKLATWVRFPSPAPEQSLRIADCGLQIDGNGQGNSLADGWVGGGGSGLQLAVWRKAAERGEGGSLQSAILDPQSARGRPDFSFDIILPRPKIYGS